MNHLDDKALLQLMQQDDEAAFTELYNRYWYPLLTHVMKAVRVESDAEDIVQELFTSFWRRRKELDLSHSLSTYLYNSARYMGIRYIERNITRSNYLHTLSLHFEENNVPSSESLLHIKELEHKINTTIATMPDKMREVFQLSRKEQLSYREIAIKLNISEETVRKQVYNALKLLKQQLGYMLVAVIFYASVYFV